MEMENKPIEPAQVLLLVLIYAILGPIGLTPAAIVIAAILFARATPILNFITSEYESFHGKPKDERLEKVRSELTESIRQASVQHKTESAGLKAQLGMLTQQLVSVNDILEKRTKDITDFTLRLSQQRKDNQTLQAEVKELKARIEILEIDSKQGILATTTAVPAKVPVVAPETKPAASTTPKILFQEPTPQKQAEPKPQPQLPPFKAELPLQLQTIDPTSSGFRCIGVARGSHGGGCGSYSYEYLPFHKRQTAMTTLTTMRSSNPGQTLEIDALHDLAHNMLCKHHCRGGSYSQVNEIAERWYNALAPARKQLKEREQILSTPIKREASGRTVPDSVSPVRSRSVSPASSCGSVSTAATTPEAVESQGSKLNATNSPFIFSAGGSPSPAPRQTSLFSVN